MLSRIAVVVLLALACVVTAQVTQDWNSASFTGAENQAWVEFKKKFGKVYATPEEQAEARYSFVENWHKINAQIERFNAGIDTWRSAVNEFSDKSHEKFMKAKCGSRRPENATGPPPEGPQPRVTYPTSYDIRISGPGKLTPVKDQRDCGSCWAFATSGVFENAYYVKTGTLISFSEQHQVDCCKTCYGCNGGWFSDSLTCTMSGLATQTLYPYKALDLTCQTSVSKPAKNTGFQNIAATVDAIKYHLTYKGAVACCVDATGWNSYSSGVYNSVKAPINCNHGIVVIGWGPDFWLIRNSWGTGWGEAGHIRVSMTFTLGGLFLDTCFGVTM